MKKEGSRRFGKLPNEGAGAWGSVWRKWVRIEKKSVSVGVKIARGIELRGGAQ